MNKIGKKNTTLFVETFAGESFARQKTREILRINFCKLRNPKNFARSSFANEKIEKNLQD